MRYGHMDEWWWWDRISSPLKVFQREDESETDAGRMGAEEDSEAGCFRIQFHSSRSLHYRNNLKQHIPISALSLQAVKKK